MVRRKTEPPRGVLKTSVTDARRYRHDRYHPSPDLDPYVEHYWTVEWDLRGLAPERVETLPHPSVHVVFESDGRSRVAGMAGRKFSRVLEGQGGVFAVKFRPGGFYPFVGIPVSNFSNKTLPLREALGADTDAIDLAVSRATTDEARVEIVERFLRERLPEPDDGVTRAAHIVYAIAATPGILRVEDVVHRYGTTARTLQRLFAKYVGVSPKWVIQRYRLHEAAERLASDPSLSQTALAMSLGYTDQAHFARDFKATVGVSPAVYARSSRSSRMSR